MIRRKTINLTLRDRGLKTIDDDEQIVPMNNAVGMRKIKKNPFFLLAFIILKTYINGY